MEMILNKEEIVVINRTDKEMRVTVVVEVEYATYNLSSFEQRVYDDYNNPKKRRIKVILDEEEGGDA